MPTWPSKAQHDAVAQRVQTLENSTPSARPYQYTLEGVNSLNDHDTRVGLSKSYSDMSVGEPVEVHHIRCTIKNTSLRVGMVSIEGATLAQFDGINFDPVSPASPDISPYYIGINDFWQDSDRPGFLVEDHAAVRITDAKCVIAFKPGTMLPRFTDGYLTRTPGISDFTLRDADDSIIPGEVIFSIGDVFSNYAIGSVGSGVLSPGAFPIRPVPTPTTRGGMAGMEIVWPVGGVPYLHVFKQSSAESIDSGLHYHLPLTAGLPT